MNYRVNLNRDEVHHLIVEKKFDQMLKYDQLMARMQPGGPLFGFREALIRFAPTYKYDPGTNIYDSSEKMRVPSWTDRVLYKGDNIRPLYYDRGEIDISDHKPVKCLFEAILSSPADINNPIDIVE